MNKDWQHKFVQVQEENVISDRDETEGVEYNAAMKSPLKGAGVHVRSNVHFGYYLIISNIMNYSTGSMSNPHQTL